MCTAVWFGRHGGRGCVTVAVVARVCCGIYAGPHKRQINAEFNALVDDVLAESVIFVDAGEGLGGSSAAGTGIARGSFLEKVLIPTLPPRNPSRS